MTRATVAAMSSGNQPPESDLGQVGSEEGQLDAAERDRGQHQPPGPPVPPAAGDDESRTVSTSSAPVTAMP